MKIAELWKNIAGERPTGVVLIAAYFVLISVWSLINVAVAFISATDDERDAFLFFGVWFALVLMAIELIFAVNLYRMKNWARQGMRFIVLLTFVGFIILVAFAVPFWMEAAEILGESPGEIFSAMDIVLFAVDMIIIAAIWHYLGRRDVVARFIHSDGKTAEDFLSEQIAEAKK